MGKEMLNRFEKSISILETAPLLMLKAWTFVVCMSLCWCLLLVAACCLSLSLRNWILMRCPQRQGEVSCFFFCDRSSALLVRSLA